MKNLSKTDGFTLIEVLIAIAIIGLVLAPIYMLQGTVLQTVQQRAHQLARLYYAKQLLIVGGIQATADEKKNRIEKKLEIPQTTFVFERKRMQKSSSLKQGDNLVGDTVTYSWMDGKVKKSEKIGGFTFRPKESS